MACRTIMDERPILDARIAVSAHCDLPPSPASAPLARRFVRSFLEGVRHDVVQDVLLLTSELVTNVVVQARTEVHIGISRDQDNVLVVVQDHSGQPGECTDVTPSKLSAIGRGMAIIAAIADDFGWKRLSDNSGKIMWFSVRV